MGKRGSQHGKFRPHMRDGFPMKCANSHKCSTGNIFGSVEQYLYVASARTCPHSKRLTCELNHCPTASTASSTIHASPIVCQYQAVASTAICRNSTRLKRFTTVRQTISAKMPTTR